jgi:hypothetical protein
MTRHRIRRTVRSMMRRFQSIMGVMWKVKEWLKKGKLLFRMFRQTRLKLGLGTSHWMETKTMKAISRAKMKKKI